VILRKLEYLREGGSNKHIRDIRFILTATHVDRTFLGSEVARLGVQAEWGRCESQAAVSTLSCALPGG